MRVAAATVLAFALCAPSAHPQALSGGDAEVTRGIQQVREGDFEGAITTLDTAIRQIKDDPARRGLLLQAYLQLGVAHIALDQRDPAAAAFREALKLQPTLRLRSDRFAPKVVRAFDAVREESARASSQSAAASRSRAGTTALIAAGTAAAVAGGVIVAAGSEDPPPPGNPFSGARFGTPVIVCADNSFDVDLPFTVLAAAHSPDRDIEIVDVSLVATVVTSSFAPEVGFASNRRTTWFPPVIRAGQPAELRLDSALLCGNGPGDPLRSNTWTASATITTSAGVFVVNTVDRMTVNLP